METDPARNKFGYRMAQAETAFEPVAKKTALDARLDALAHWIAAQRKAASARSAEALAAAIAANKRDFDARFELAQTHFAAARFTAAMDELLEIVMRDKAWNGELARKTFVAILTVMARPAAKPAEGVAKGALEVTGKTAAVSADPVVDQYRRKLSMALF